jgi:hypothetical protein
VGAECAVSTAVPVCQQPQGHDRVLGIVYRAIATHLAHKAGFTATMAKCGAVTLIKRFGSALNLYKQA